jgi:hypothetical protein
LSQLACSGRYGSPLRFADAFKVTLAGEPEQPLAVLVNVIPVKKTFAALRYHGVNPELAVDQRSLAVRLIVSFGGLIPEQIESIEDRLGTPEQQITELRLAVWIEANDLAV